MKNVLSVICFLMLATAHGQNVNYIHYNTNNSKLPHDIVYRLQQDKAGFLWISTDDGLVRFDGTEMVNFDKGFVSKYIIGTNEEKGRNWVCTWKGGIHFIDKDSAVLVNALTYGGKIMAYSTNDILVFNNLVISHSFKRYMVYTYDSLKNTIIPYSLKLKQDTFYLLTPEDEEYYRFIKTSSHHLYAYDSKNVFEVVENKLKRLNTTIVPDNMWESPSGILYFQKNENIYSTNSDFSLIKLQYKVPLEKFGNKIPASFRVLPSGNLCLGFASPELHNSNPVYYLLNTRTGDILDFSKEIIGEVLSADLLVDREGGIWLSTDGHGLYHIFDMKYKLIGGTKVFDNSTITDLLLLGKDSLFIGTKEGLYLHTRQETQFLKYPFYGQNLSVKNLFVTDDNTVGVSLHSSESFAYTDSKGRHSTLSYIERLVFDNYIVTVPINGPIRVTGRKDLKDHSFRFIDPRPTYNIKIAEGERGVLWMTYGGDLFYYHPDSGLHQLNEPELKNVLINCLLSEKGKGIWLGTNQGLFLLSDNASLKYWGTNEGLTNCNIRCLFSDKKHSLWIGTQNGLFHFMNDEFSIYKRRDGLIADDVSCIEYLGNNELAVGSAKGVSLFYMQTPSEQIPPELVVEQFEANNRAYDWREAIDVPYNNSIFLKYRVITFIYPELLLFQYRLNENEDWISTQNNSLVFTNLKPGNYNLELRAKKYNTDFSKPLLINFKIDSPWWRSLYFYAVILIFCLVLVYFYFYFRFNRQKQKAQARQELAELRMKALQAQLNPHFVSNALNSIQYFILKRDEVSANNYLAQFTDLTRLFLEVSRSRLISLETELELLKNYLSLEKLRFEDRFVFSINIDPSIKLKETYIPGLLIQPIVENSINHGIVYLPKNITGTITISIVQEKNLRIIITDNGIGRQKANEIKKRLEKSYRSHSSKILEELQQAYNMLPGCEISMVTFDMENGEKKSTGTRVEITVLINKQLVH